MPELVGGKPQTVLKFAVDNVNLALCDSHDLFLAPVLIKMLKMNILLFI